MTLSAAPDADYHFVSWSGDAPAGRETDNPLVLTMDSEKTLTALFARDTGTIAIMTSPTEATWSLLGPDGVAIDDNGSTTMLGMPTGVYSIEWRQIAHWDMPQPTTATLTLTHDGSTTFSGIYSRHLGSVTINASPSSATWT